MPRLRPQIWSARIAKALCFRHNSLFKLLIHPQICYLRLTIISSWDHPSISTSPFLLMGLSFPSVLSPNTRGLTTRIYDTSGNSCNDRQSDGVPRIVGNALTA